MKKGRINLLSFEGDEEEVDFHNQKIRQNKEKDEKRSLLKKNKPRLEVDFSQIRDRVVQMDFNEEIILEGDSAEAFIRNNYTDNENLYSEEEEELNLAKKIKEAKLKRSLKEIDDKDQEDQELELPDYIPVTTKGEYWLNRDTRESEEAFNSTTSRLVREDLFNEMEIDNGNEGFTQFFGKDFGGRRGIMMTSKMLERDIKSELYDLELDVNDAAENDEISEVMWEQSQVLKGIEKGWNHLEGDGNNFLSIQAKLSTFIPPKPLNGNSFNNADLKINSDDLKKLEENIEKIKADSKKLEERINELKLEIEVSEVSIKKSNEIETFFMRYSRFLSGKVSELQSLELEFDDLNLDVKETDHYRRWECFFDDVDEEDSDLLDLPEIIKKYKMTIENNLSLNQNKKYLVELTGLFVRYHFLSIDDDTKDIWTVYKESGLSSALNLINNEDLTDLKLIDVIFEETGKNSNRVKRIRDEILIKMTACENN